MKWCGLQADSIALIATVELPSVPFLKPTGKETPEANSRWSWLSVVLAPIAPQEMKSPINCGVIVSKSSAATGIPKSVYQIIYY